MPEMVKNVDYCSSKSKMMSLNVFIFSLLSQSAKKPENIQI